MFASGSRRLLAARLTTCARTAAFLAHTATFSTMAAAATGVAAAKGATASPISEVGPISFPMRTSDPFLFAVYHKDMYREYCFPKSHSETATWIRCASIGLLAAVVLGQV